MFYCIKFIIFGGAGASPAFGSYLGDLGGESMGGAEGFPPPDAEFGELVRNYFMLE